MGARASRAPRAVGFACCQRYVGAATVPPGAAPALRPTRIRGHVTRRLEHARLTAWIERTVVQQEVELVAVVGSDNPGEAGNLFRALVRTVAERNGLPLIEVSREEMALVFGAWKATNAAICTRLAAEHPAVAAELGRRGVRSFLGPRSEAVRYWTMPLLAFGAALCAVRLSHIPMPT